MSAAGNTPNLPEMPVPRCPHCGLEIAAMGLYNWVAGLFMILAMFCPHCKKILDLQALPMEIQEAPRIARPS